MKNIEPTSPNAMVLPRGDHILEPERIIGVTPTAAAMVVRKIGPQPALARFDGCFLDCDAFRHSGADIVDQDDGVAHDHAAQTDDAQERREAEWIPCHQQAERRAQQPERNRRHDHQRIGHGTELKHQDQEDRDHADEQRFHHLGKGVALVFKFTAIPIRYPGATAGIDLPV